MSEVTRALHKTSSMALVQLALLATAALLAWTVSVVEAGYVHVDWGPDFALHHAVSFPGATPNIFVDLGPLALSYILMAGGSGYFRLSAVEPHIASGQVHLVPGAPRFSYPVYVVYSANADDATLGPALDGLRAIIVKEPKGRRISSANIGENRHDANVRGPRG